MAKRTIKNKKANPTQKQLKTKQTFINDVKHGKYGPVETSSVVYVRLSEQAEPYEQHQKTHLYYGVR